MGKIAWVMAAVMIVHASVGCSGSDSMPTAATPTFSPGPGTYLEPQSVTVSSTIAGATIYYTLDGSSPTTASLVYSSPIALSATTTIKAIAVADGYSASASAIGTYTINLPTQAATPTFSPPPGEYMEAQMVALTCATEGATIYYTIDDSGPSPGSTRTYSGPIRVFTTTTIRAIAIANGYASSGTATGTYTIKR
jgi:hypothetical protein